MSPKLFHFFTHTNDNNIMAHREGITTTSHDWTMVTASSLVKDQKVITM